MSTVVDNEAKTLHLIAGLKVLKGCVLLAIAASLLILESRPEWLSALIEWAEDELLLMHSPILMWLLNRLDVMLQAPNLKQTGILALIYAIVLLVEGVGVWKQQRWAEWLMICATSSLIPLELMHMIHKPSMFKCIVIVVNAAIVWYLWRTLKRHRPTSH